MLIRMLAASRQAAKASEEILEALAGKRSSERPTSGDCPQRSGGSRTVYQSERLAIVNQRFAAYAILECYGLSTNIVFNGQNALPPSPTSLLIRPSVSTFVVGLR